MTNNNQQIRGAGRPSELNNPKKVTFWLEAQQIEWLNNQKDKSKIIRLLIDKAMKEDNGK